LYNALFDSTDSITLITESVKFVRWLQLLSAFDYH